MKKKKEVNYLASGGFWTVNKTLARHFKSNDAAALLAELIYKFEYWKTKGKLKEDGFFVKGVDLQKDVNITKRQRLKLTKILTDAGLIVVRRKGATARNWYSIQFPAIAALLDMLKKPKSKEPKVEKNASWSETAPINNNLSTIKKNKDFFKKAKPEGRSIKADATVEVHSLVFDRLLDMTILGPVCDHYLAQRPENKDLVEALLYIIKNDKSITHDPRWQANNGLCLDHLNELIRGRELSERTVANVFRIYEKNLEHQKKLESGEYLKTKA